MKYCEKCGNQLSDDAMFCSACGTKLAKSMFTIDGMEGHVFERFCAEILKKNGFYDVSVTPGSGDQGVDVLATKDGIKYAIQCKNYSSVLSNTPVQEVNTGKVYYGCHVGVVMTNSTFSKGAVELANATNVLLWDGTKVKEMMKMLSDEDIRNFGASEYWGDEMLDDDYLPTESTNEKDTNTVPIRKGMERFSRFFYIFAAIVAISSFSNQAKEFRGMFYGEALLFLILGFMFQQLKWSPKGFKHVLVGKLLIKKWLFIFTCVTLGFYIVMFCSEL